MFNSMEYRVRRLELAADAQRLMGLYAHELSLGEYDKIPELFALDTETVSAEMLWGRYEGRAGIEKLYRRGFPLLRDAGGTAVTETLQALEVPIISPAKDCLTVKAVWVCPGYYTLRKPDGTETGFWSWQKYACDFIVCDGVLKIWHLHTYGLFETEYLSDDLIESGIWQKAPEKLPPELLPDTPPTTQFHLSPESVYPHTPEIPKPYTVFDMDRRY